MIGADRITGVVVTRGDVPLTGLLTLKMLDEVKVWTNSAEQVDLSVYGRYAAVEEARNRVALVIDDDVALPTSTVEALLAAYESGTLVANMPAEYRERYPDSALVGFGAIFDVDLPAKAFARFREHQPRADNPWFQRTCDIVFSMLTPRVLVELPFEMLPHTFAANRMYRQQGNGQERQRMIQTCREILRGS